MSALGTPAARDANASADREPLAPMLRDAYPAFLAIPTRWIDNDVYGHVNNAVFYAYFDTVVNEHLIRAGLDIRGGREIGVVVETACRYHTPIAFPDAVHAGLRVAAIGRSSVRYEIAIFRGDDREAAATGRFVHVWVDRSTRRPVAVPARIRAALERLEVA